LLRGEAKIELRKDPDKASTKRQTRTPLPSDIDIALWEALRECRRSFASELGIPPYVVFNDASLTEMCQMLPTDFDNFSMISGVGERKLEKYGPAFISVISEHLASY
jgi:ATP-dependent DNA helicase RecQ